MAEIGLKDVRKSYGETEVIKGVDWDIRDGEFVVIVGPSGCGKSTLLRMIAGLESITAGDVSIGGRRVNDLEPAQRDIAMVFQNYALYPHMSVRKNMAYALKIAKVPQSEIDARVDRAAGILELTDYLDRNPRQLSGGQRQRVAMGRAIVREPSVFLFDEPLSNLDAKLRVQMRLEIKKLQADLGITSVYVTHDQVEAMTLGDRLAVLNGGVVEQLGTPIEIYEKPATMFVAGFIGSPSMNLITARLDATGGHVEIENAKPVKIPTPAAQDTNRNVVLGIRPEHFEIGTPENYHVKLRVAVVEQLGADTLVHGLIEGAEKTVVARFEGIKQFSAGEDLPLLVPMQALHLFDPQSQKRI